MQLWLGGYATLGLRLDFCQRTLEKTEVEEHEIIFTGLKTGIVWSSRKNGRDSLV